MNRLHPSAFLPPWGQPPPVSPLAPLAALHPKSDQAHLCLEPSFLFPSFNSEKGHPSGGPVAPSGSPLPPEPHFLPHTFILYMHPLLQPQRLPCYLRPQAPASGPLHLLCPLPGTFFLTASYLLWLPAALLYNSGPAPHCYVLPSTAVICALHDGRLWGAVTSVHISCRALPQRARVSVSLGPGPPLLRPSCTKMLLKHHQPSPSTSRVLASFL